MKMAQGVSALKDNTEDRKFYQRASHLKSTRTGTSLVVQWLRLCASNAEGVGLIPGQGTKIPHAMHCGQKLKKQGTRSKQLNSIKV